MHWSHPEHPGRRVRLAYCLNLHPAETLEETVAGIRAVTLPLRDRLAPGARFGVGLYLPHKVAAPLAAPDGARALEGFAAFLADEDLDPFTFNAFPYGGFHAGGLKERVFRPTWAEPERLAFTLAVARVAAALARRAEDLAPPAHVSISTHSGAFGADATEELLRACAAGLARAAASLAALEQEGGPRVVLALEPEPRASANDLGQLARFLARVRGEGDAERWGIETLAAETALAPETLRRTLARHLGTCLDACHAAVEFEDPPAAFAADAPLGPLGKLQFSSALALRDPGRSAAARSRLLALDEPRYLHQVTGRLPGDPAGLLRVADLGELAQALDGGASDWERCDEWRCHFHVPVDLAALGDTGLGTTRAVADRILRRALADPGGWGTRELHLEIETYTWDILPGAARGAGGLVDGLEREYRHVIEVLEQAGWHPG
jgi:sugar phosphate isomerase/epimerase